MTTPSMLCLAVVLLQADTMIVPLGDPDAWAEAAYSDIRPNSVSVDDGAMRIDVESSASPLIHAFANPVDIVGFNVKASWRGGLDIPSGTQQGSAAADDFVLKIGLVVSGRKQLNWIQRRLAADWVRSLYSLAPEGGGIDTVRFFSTTQQEDLVGQARMHPQSDLIHEERILYLESTGPFTLSKRFDTPVEVLGLWLAADGDATSSRFSVTIEEIVLSVVQQ